MPEENKNIDNDDKNKEAENKDKGSEVTLESLKEIVTSQAGLMEALKTENANNISQLTQVFQEKYGLMESDMQNLTSLLGGLANPDINNNDEQEDLTNPENIKNLVNRTVKENKNAENEAVTKQNKSYWKEYGEMSQELMDEEGPDGKPLSPEAREGIKKLIIETSAEKTSNATRDARKGFRKASRVFFGLDKTHGFKGGSIEGIGGGSADADKGGNKKVYKMTDEMKQELKDIGETEEWGQKKLKERAEAEQLA